MRLLIITKRHPQQRDLLTRPYGRFFHLPVELAALGHDVLVATVSHRRSAAESLTRDGVRWIGRDLLDGTSGFWRDLKSQAMAFEPDWVVGCSDAWLGWMAHRLSAATGARLAIDAYDDFEAYMPWNLPLHWAWRRSLAAASLISAAGPQLADRLSRHARAGSTVEIVPMAADPQFKPLSRQECRTALQLPSGPLVGYSGSWSRSRGTEKLMQAFATVTSRNPAVRLVLSGRPPAEVAAAANVISLGYLPDDSLPQLINALDVACVVTADTRFGRYSYPAKLCEAIACGVPVAATDTPPVRWMLADNERCLAPVGDAERLADRILALLDCDGMDYGHRHAWKDSAARLEQGFKRAAA